MPSSILAAGFSIILCMWSCSCGFVKLPWDIGLCWHDLTWLTNGFGNYVCMIVWYITGKGLVTVNSVRLTLGHSFFLVRMYCFSCCCSWMFERHHVELSLCRSVSSFHIHTRTIRCLYLRFVTCRAGSTSLESNPGPCQNSVQIHWSENGLLIEVHDLCV